MSPIKAISILVGVVLIIGGAFLFLYLKNNPVGQVKKEQPTVEQTAEQVKKAKEVTAEAKKAEMIEVLKQLNAQNVSSSTQPVSPAAAEEKRQEMTKVLQQLNAQNKVSTTTQVKSATDAEAKRQEMIKVLQQLNAQN